MLCDATVMVEVVRDHAAEFGDFTEASYRELLRIAKQAYTFERYINCNEKRSIIWRHDLDTSVHRAKRFAEIETEEGVISTYFLYLRCPYYNMLSGPIAVKMREILALGHDIALHFDPTFYGETLEDAAFVDAVARERDLLEAEFGQSPTAVSFHNFGILDQSKLEDDTIAGMVNAYGTSLKEKYGYISDSHGVWRFRRLRTVLEEAKEDRLQVLTHPEWWTPEVMPPRARLQRAIDGYAAAMGDWYDEFTARHDRPNIR